MMFQLGLIGRSFIIFFVLSQQMCFGADTCPTILYTNVIGRDQKGTLMFGNQKCAVEIKNDHLTMYLAIAAAAGFLLWILTLCIICCICCCKCKTSHYNERKQNKRELERFKQGPPTAPPPGEAPRPNRTKPAPKENESVNSVNATQSSHNLGNLGTAPPPGEPPRPNRTGPAPTENEPVYGVNATQSWHGSGSFTLNSISRMYDAPPKSLPRDDEVASAVDRVRSLRLDDDNLYDSHRIRNRRLAIYLAQGRSNSIAVDSFSLSQFKSKQNEKPSHPTVSDQGLEVKGVPVFPEVGLQKSVTTSKENNEVKKSTFANGPDNLYDIVDIPVS